MTQSYFIGLVNKHTDDHHIMSNAPVDAILHVAPC